MRSILTLSLALTLLPLAASAADSGNAEMRSELSYGYGSRMQSSMQSQLELLPALDLSLNRSIALKTSVRLRVDAEEALEPGRPDLDNYAPGSKPLYLGTAGTAELRDLFIEFSTGNGLFRLGKQQVNWGRLDGIKVLDLVNPQDFREFILDDFADSRIGLWSAYLDLSLGNWRAELAVIPDGTGHQIPVPGAWFELSAPRFRFGSDSDSPAPPIVTESPGHALDQTAAGLRLSRQFGTLELGLVAYTGNDPEPLGRLIPAQAGVILERFYERRDAYGFSLDMPLGAIVIRAEYAWQPSRVFNTRSGPALDTIALDQHRSAIGIDVDGPLGVFINVQYLDDTISDAPAELVRPGRDRIATLYLRRAFAYDSVILSARSYYSFTDRDYLIAAGLSYALTDDTSIGISAETHGGTTDGLFGQFEDRDRITLNLRHTF